MLPGCEKEFVGPYAGYCSGKCRTAASKIAASYGGKTANLKGSRATSTWDSKDK